MINQVEQSANRVNELMNDMGMMVEEQGENLNVITEELTKAKDNVIAANENL
jgi:t-SNARE complex subunit (syntaxin)